MSKPTPEYYQSLIDKKNLFIIHHEEESTNDLQKSPFSHLSPDESIESIQTGRWNKREHERFIIGILQYGNEWKKVEEVVKTRSSTQARSHAQKFFIKIKNNKKLSIGQFSTIKKFCEKIKSLDQNNKCLLLRELRDIPFDSEDVSSKKIKNKSKTPKHMKQLKKIKAKGKESVINKDLIDQNWNKVDPIPLNTQISLNDLTQVKAINNIPQNNQIAMRDLNCFNDNHIIYNNNINNLNISFHQNGYLDMPLNQNNPVSNINNTNFTLNQNVHMPLNNGQPMSLFTDNYWNLFGAMSTTNWGNMLNYANQQYSPMLFQDLCRNYL